MSGVAKRTGMNQTYLLLRRRRGSFTGGEGTFSGKDTGGDVSKTEKALKELLKQRT